ncbi:hypothetical protein [Paraliomyxa miuraensis]|uniref:hypothetical protein n=1 Tax=Paraliomyxa miuraensis TaxID=376150 RepID=UPI002256EF10|nr:hypothetical protein [Paraliomyxa miuraensis]MCX4245300.1 hypothetical protein [Paraliomyxa miuraensis]
MTRSREILWFATAASCVLAGRDDAAHEGRGSTPVEQVATVGDEQEMSLRSIRGTLWPQLGRTPYVAPDAARLEATEAALHAATLHALGLASLEPVPRIAHAAGLVVERWRVGRHHYLALLERSSERGSTGAFLLRIGPPSGPERLLQAPHAFHDLGTGELALEILLAEPASFRGLFTNTMHRYVQLDGDKRKQEGEDNPSDVCHNDAHAFVAATMGVVRAVGAIEVVQLHGYADDHVLPDRPEARAVVSAGADDDGGPRVEAVAAALQDALGVPIARYPEDVAELGGVTNVIGRRLRREPSASFLHIELSGMLRKELRRRDGAAARFAAALRATAIPSGLEPEFELEPEPEPERGPATAPEPAPGPDPGPEEVP